MADRTCGQPTDDNVPIRGDARSALDSLLGLADYASRYVGQVQLAHPDHAFKTGNSHVH